MNPDGKYPRWYRNAADERLAQALARASWLDSIRRRKEKRK